MPIRKGDDSKDFNEQLKSPLKPINDTSVSPDMEEYLKKLDDGTLKSEETKKAEEQKKKDEEEGKKYTLFCPTCRKPNLKRGPNGWACGFCGLETNTPLRMAESKS